jgi:predicted TIM-barrel fold metal-dependent hydrolase
MLIDFHTHAFPDALAARAMPVLEAEGKIKATLNGTVSDLLRSMDANGISTSVLCSIATKPAQFAPILKWSGEVRSERIIPFPSVHPADPLAVQRIAEIHAAGFKGVKLHPYYQEFDVDEERLFPLYAECRRLDLLVVCHTGFDIAFPRVRKGNAERVRRVLDRLPGLKFVTTHMGAWEDWEEVRRFLLGRPVLMETSFSAGYMSADAMREMLTLHPKDCILFGSDSPWLDQRAEFNALRSLGLDADRERCLFHDNARRLLGLP